LSDFGIARHDDDAHLTQTGMVIGTGAYMAPEQVEARPVTAAADIYALGLVLLECLTGTAAFPGAPAEAALARLARQPDIPTLPAPWPALLTSMTAREPGGRPSAADVAAQLRGAPPITTVAPTTVAPTTVAAATPAEVSATDVLPARTTTRPRTRASRGPLVATMIAIALAVAALAAFALTRADDDGGGADSSTTTTTVAQLASTTTTTIAPTTTINACAQQQAQRDALDAQAAQIDEILKGKAAADAKRELDVQRKALDEALKSC
jgi:serine/threonine protein kinase